MEIIVGKTSGFCFGVKNAISKTEEQLENETEVFCLGELVHNKQVIEKLESNGVKFINDIKDAKNKVIFRAHGAEKKTYEYAKNNNIEIVDLTCPKVLAIHKIVEKYVDEDYYIILVGQRKHPEVIATESFCGENYKIIEKTEEIDSAIENFFQSKKKNLLVLAQTTYSLDKFNKIVEEIKLKVPCVEIKNTICSATRDRQEEIVSLANKVNEMIIVGGKHSSNTNKLYELAKKYCSNSQIVETVDDLDIKKIENCETVGIMAGASTPDESVEQIIKVLKCLKNS